MTSPIFRDCCAYCGDRLLPDEEVEPMSSRPSNTHFLHSGYCSHQFRRVK